MKTITFFSYKGGVGRTLTATNFAVYLAKLGLKVVIMDFDLDAPGVDSKFPDFSLPSGQAGLLDYILRFQKDGTDPGPISSIVLSIPIKSPRQKVSLGLIPAGDYLSPDYSSKLNELNWTTIFQSRDGVAFFQEFLSRIAAELSPDVLVIDSRTGFNEIGGLCTLQLADETVFLTSLAAESIKMTRHLSKIISASNISKSLKKKVDTKIVVCRVPKPSENIDTLKARCRKEFEVDDSRLFFLFSCRELEREEFVAMLDTSKQNDLVANYMQLFRGLDVEVAERSIQEEIQKTEAGLLSGAPAEAEARIRELVALYPHSDVYRTAMRFFELRRQPEEAVVFGIRLLELLAADKESITLVARFFLSGERYHLAHRSQKSMQRELEPIRLIPIAMRAYKDGLLTIEERVRLADHLEDVHDFAECYLIAIECLKSGEITSAEFQSKALGIAARTAMRLQKHDEAAKLIDGIPIPRLGPGLANVAVQLKLITGDKPAAFDIARTALSKDFHPKIMETAIALAKELGKAKELEESLLLNSDMEAALRHDQSLSWHLQSIGIDASEFAEHSRRRRHRVS